MKEKIDPETSVRRLYKSRKDKMIDGVCAGVAEYFAVDPTLVRIVWTLAVFMGGLGIPAYILGMIFIPPNPEHEGLNDAQKKQWNQGVLWGGILIFMGFAFFLNRWNYFSWRFPMSFRFRYFHGIPWEIIWPLVLIAFGVAYLMIVSRKKEEKNEEAASQKEIRRRWVRSRKHKILGGVCGGLAEYLSMDPAIVRIIVAAVALTHIPFWAILYLIAVFAIPLEDAEPDEES
ncbi:MAG TPA: PspC domain-containing protein [bacterium]|nr:PspC domain-containing protein [bacterium]